MASKRLRVFLIPPLLLFLLLAACILLADSLIQRPAVQRYLLDELSRAVGCEIRATDIRISFWRGVGFSARSLEVRSPSGSGSVRSSRVWITLDARQLLNRRIVPRKIFLDEGEFHLPVGSPSAPSRPGGAPSLGKSFPGVLDRLRWIALARTRFSFGDLPFRLEDIHADMSAVGGEPGRFRVLVRGAVRFRGERVPVALHGTIGTSPGTPADTTLDVVLEASRVPMVWGPWPDHLPMKAGLADVSVRIKGRLRGPVSLGGTITMEGVRFSVLGKHGAKPFSEPRLVFDFDASFSNRVLRVSSYRMTSPDFMLTGDARIDFALPRDPHIRLNVRSTTVPVERFHRIFPTSLLSPWIERRLFPILSGGGVRVRLFSLNGPWHRIDRLGHEENAAVLVLRLSWDGLDVLKGRAEVPFSGVSGRLDIEKGALTLSDVTGRFGGSSIREGELRIPSLYADRALFDVSVSGLFRVEDLLHERTLDLVPGDVKANLGVIREAAGEMDARVRLRFVEGASYPRSCSGDLRFADCRIDQPELFFPVLLKEGALHLDRDGGIRFQGDGRWGNSRLTVSGSAGKGLDPLNARVEGRADGRRILARFNIMPGTFSMPDLTPFTLALSARDGAWSLEGEAGVAGVTVVGPAFSLAPPGEKDRIAFRMDLRPGKDLMLREVTGFFGKSVVRMSGTWGLDGRDACVLAVSADDVDMEDLGLRVGDGADPVKGIFSCDVRLAPSFRSSRETRVNGKMSFRDLALLFPGLPSPVHDGRCRVLFSGTGISVPSLDLVGGRSPLHVTADLTGWHGLKGTVAVTSDFLDISDFVPAGSGKKSPSGAGMRGKGLLSGLDLKMRVKARKGQWRKLAYRRLSASCRFSGGRFRVEHVSARTTHGRIRMNAHDRGAGPQRDVGLYVNLSDQPMKELLVSLGISKPFVEGRLTMEGFFSFEQGGEPGPLSTLSGSANIFLKKGKLRENRVIFKILDFLSLQKIFKRKPPDLSKEGLYFESIKGHVGIREGIVRTDSMVMKSPVFNAGSRGVVDLGKKRINLEVGAQPLGTIDWMVSRIPIVGYILTGKEKSLLIYYFRISGPLSGPDVRYVPLKHVRNVAGLLKRAFLTPGRLFKKIPNPFRETEENGLP